MAIQIQDLSELFGIGSSWEVSEITYDSEQLTAEIHVIYSKDLVLRCPECGKACPGYDHRRRKWCHTRICDYHTQCGSEGSSRAVFGAWDQDGIGAMGGCAGAVYDRI